jgi:hypothetical protein
MIALCSFPGPAPRKRRFFPGMLETEIPRRDGGMSLVVREQCDSGSNTSRILRSPKKLE